MKNIILATDFSTNAHIAAIFAGEITCHLGGRLIILHALPPLARQNNGTYLTVNAKTEEEAQKELDVLAKELHSRFGISVSRLLKPGYAETEVPFLTKSLKAKLTIMGAQGENFQQNRTLGSVAKELLSKDHYPVVCIPAQNFLNLSAQLAYFVNNPLPFSNSSGLQLLTDVNAGFSPEKALPNL